MYLFKVNNRNTRKRCKISSKLTINTPERRKRLYFNKVAGLFSITPKRSSNTSAKYFRQNCFSSKTQRKTFALLKLMINKTEVPAKG